MLAGFDGDLELGADAVIGRHQHGIRETGSLEIEEPAEAADLSVCAWPPRGAHGRLDLLDHQVAGIDIDARLGIGEPVLRHRSVLRLSCAAIRMNGFRPQAAGRAAPTQSVDGDRIVRGTLRDGNRLTIYSGASTEEEPEA
jgi:hypothetical protein